MAVKDNYVVIRMGVAILDDGVQVGREKGFAGGWDSKELWKCVEKASG
jgi:hypothetical protein